MSDRKIRVLVVDDSATVRYFLSGLINATPDMTVVGEAADGLQALEAAARLRPDVISMDIRMPRLDGLSATRQLMEDDPRPIVIVSSRLERSEVDLAFMALQAGALAVLSTPPGPPNPAFAASRDQYLTTLRAMAGVSVVRRWKTRPLEFHGIPLNGDAAAPLVIVIGASAGGPVALHRLLGDLPADFPVPIAIVQHMAEGFMDGMARWLDAETALHIRVAEDGQLLLPGQVVLAESGAHLLVRRAPEGVRLALDATPTDSPYQPAVNRLFASAAEAFGRQAIGVLLTGMGEDGAQGLLRLRGAGGRTIAQDEASCLVYGMPGAAVALGAAEQILPLKHIGPALIDLAQPARRSPAASG